MLIFSSVVPELKKPLIFAEKFTMIEAERIARQKELIEALGRSLEKQGYQPVAGRILAMLMASDKEEFTFDEIVDEMKISKSTASNALKTLELRETIEYVTHSGDRKRYFRISFSDIKMVVNEIKKRFEASSAILDEVISLKKDPNSKNAQALKSISKGIRLFLSVIDQSQNKD